MAIERAAADAYEWLHSQLDPGQGDRHYVRELLPRRYQRYVRVLDPWHPAQSPEPRLRWRELAERAGVEWYPEISWYELEVVARRPASDVDLFVGADSPTRQRVVEHLTRAAAAPYFVAYEIWASVSLIDSPMIIQVPTLDLSVARDQASALASQPHPVLGDPEHWWPQDRSWIVSCDYDLDELYVAASRDLGQALLDDRALEAVEVSLDSRVDWRVDADRRRGGR